MPFRWHVEQLVFASTELKVSAAPVATVCSVVFVNLIIKLPSYQKYKGRPTEVSLPRIILNLRAHTAAACSLARKGPGTGIRVSNDIGRVYGRAKLVDEIGVLSLLGSRQISRCQTRTELSNRVVLSSNLVCNDLIMQLAVVRIIILHDSLGLLSDCVRDSAGVGRHIILDLGLTLFVLAAAISQLGLESIGILHGCNIVGIDGLLEPKVALEHRSIHTVESGQHTIVHSIETIAHAVIDAVELRDDVLGIKTALDVSLGSSRSNIATAVTITTIAPAIAAEAAPHGKQDNDDPPAVTAPTAITVVSGHSSNIGKRGHIRVKHKIFLLHKECRVKETDYHKSFLLNLSARIDRPFSKTYNQMSGFLLRSDILRICTSLNFQRPYFLMPKNLKAWLIAWSFVIP
nr:MAG TPA: hypothetical protein [Caudoviricetes sp.]